MLLHSARSQRLEGRPHLSSSSTQDGQVFPFFQKRCSPYSSGKAVTSGKMLITLYVSIMIHILLLKNKEAHICSALTWVTYIEGI